MQDAVRGVDGIARGIAERGRGQLQLQPLIELTGEALRLVRPSAEGQSRERLLDLLVRCELTRRPRLGEDRQRETRPRPRASGREGREHEAMTQENDATAHKEKDLAGCETVIASSW